MDRKEREIFIGCAIDKCKCDGICAETFGTTCQYKMRYYLEPVYKKQRFNEDTRNPRKLIKRYRRVELS